MTTSNFHPSELSLERQLVITPEMLQAISSASPCVLIPTVAVHSGDGNLMKRLLTLSVLIVSQPLSASTPEINLSCTGKFKLNGANEVAVERSFVIRGKSAYFWGNVAACDISPDRIRCWKRNDQSSRWTIEFDRVTGRVDYSFANPPLGIEEEFQGVCKTVNRAI